MFNGPDPNRPCKFGPNCNRLRDGSCTFYHAQLHGGGGQNGGRGGRGHGGRGNYPDQSYHDGGRGGRGGRNNYPNQQQGGRGGKPQYNHSPNDISAQFCRDYQLRNQCNYGQKCKRKHGFMNPDNIKRLFFSKDLPQNPISKLTSFVTGGKTYYSMRNGNSVFFFDFDPETVQLKDIGNWSLPDQNANYHYFSQINNFIYFAAENPKTGFTDMYYHNVQNSVTSVVENGHLGKITSMLHLTDKIMLSAALDGEIKVWQAQSQTKMMINKNATDTLQQYYNPSKAKMEIQFLSSTEVTGIRVVSAGTNDNRVLLFVGEQMTYKQVVLPNNYNKVFAIKYANFKGDNLAFVLAWNDNATSSALFGMKLNTLEPSIVMQVNTDTDKPRLLISHFQIIDDLMFVGNQNGLISIYRIPDFQTKVGVMMHQNGISDIIISRAQFKTTNISIRNLFVLEKRTPQREGSMGIYLIK